MKGDSLPGTRVLLQPIAGDGRPFVPGEVHPRGDVTGGLPHRRFEPMRSCGVISSLRDLGPSDHVAWGYESVSELTLAVTDFLGEGIANGMRVAVATVESAPSDHARSLVEAVRAFPPGQVAEWSLPLDPDRPPLHPVADVERLRRAVDRSVAAGYLGVRAAVDVTALLARPEAAESLAGFAQNADRLMAELENVSALFCYDRTKVAPEVAAGLECVHPVSNQDAPFRLFVPDAHADVAVVGELDAFSAAEFERALVRSYAPSTEPWVIDGSRLTFIDHRAMLAIDRAATRLGTIAVLETVSGQPGRIADSLGLLNVRVVEYPRAPTADPSR